MTQEEIRLQQTREGGSWKKWGPYLSERQWGTVREDYSKHGNAWDNITHDNARSKAYRWGEEGIGGFSDDLQRICFAWAFWNGKDPILKERLYGLSGREGNHGEDVKELYYYLDNTPTHSYMRMLYKYPWNVFPYVDLVETNARRSRSQKEYEILDTGIFDKNEYFDIFLSYAKVSEEDFLFECDVFNRGNKPAILHILPTIWFRNTWSSEPQEVMPNLNTNNKKVIKLTHPKYSDFYLHLQEDVQEVIFTNNDTNRDKLYGSKSAYPYVKDGINEYLINKKKTVNPSQEGTKASGRYAFKIDGGKSTKVKVRLSIDRLSNPFKDFDDLMRLRKSEADDFYAETVQKNVSNEEHRMIQRQALAGLLWSKQFYYYNIKDWLDGDPRKVPPPPE